MAHPLPSEYRFGKVVGRAIHAIADTAADEDHLPEARPAVGKVTFKPRTSIRKALHDYSAFVIKGSVHAELDPLGRIIDAEGRLGIWLVTGLYNVTFSLADGQIPPFEIEVTDAHTDENPLDLVTAAPPQPGPGITVQTVIIPAGAAPGQVLGWTADGLAWTDPEVAGDVSPEVIAARDAAVSAAGSAQAAATAASQSALDAEGSATAAAGSASTASTAVGSIGTSVADAEAAATQAGVARDAAVVAQGAAETARDEAVQAAQQASGMDARIITGPGRPDVPATTSGAITGTETVGTEYRSTDGAGVGAWVWMKRPSGWIITDGDTGWLDARSLLPEEVTGTNAKSVGIRRIGPWIEVAFNVAVSVAGTHVVQLPIGLQRSEALWEYAGQSMTTVHGNAGVVGSARVERTILQFSSSETGSHKRFGLVFSTDQPMPATVVLPSL